MTSKSNFNRLDNIDETTTQLDFFTSNNSKIINENIIQNKVNMFSNIFKDYDSTSIIYENVTNKIHENDEYLFNNSQNNHYLVVTFILDSLIKVNLVKLMLASSNR